MQWQTLLQWIQSLLNQAGVFDACLVIILTVIAHMLWRTAHQHYRDNPKLQPKAVPFLYLGSALFMRALCSPVYALIWTQGALFLLALWGRHFHIPWIHHLFFVLQNVALTASLVWFLSRLVTQLETHYIHHPPKKKSGGYHTGWRDVTTIQGISRLIRISIWILATVVIMDILGIPISGVLAFGGVGGIAVGFAANGLLSNFFGGLMVFLDRPFKVGDWVRSPDAEIEGTVEFIGWRATRIRTFDKRPLYVPNVKFLSISLENPSRMTNRRIKTCIGLRYQDAEKVDSIVKDLKAMLDAHPEIDNQQTTFVHLVEFAPSSLDILMYTFTKTVDWVRFQAVQENVFLKSIEIIRAHGAQCALPTSHIYWKKMQDKQA